MSKRIRMLETVEDSHGWPELDAETNAWNMRYDVRKFYQDQEYEDESPDWDRRADGLVKLGKAVYAG